MKSSKKTRRSGTTVREPGLSLQPSVPLEPLAMLEKVELWLSGNDRATALVLHAEVVTVITAAKLKQLGPAIRKLTRNDLVDLIDEADGVGCWDEASMDRLREEVSRLFSEGMIAEESILEIA